MTIKNLLEDSGTPQFHITRAFGVSKAIVCIWTNKRVSQRRYNMIRGYLVAQARLFLTKYEKNS